MLGFVIGLGTELLTGQGILTPDLVPLNLKHFFQVTRFPIFWAGNFAWHQ